MAVMQAGVSKAAEVGRKKIASPSQSSRVRIRFSPRVDQKQKSRKVVPDRNQLHQNASPRHLIATRLFHCAEPALTPALLRPYYGLSV